MSPNLHGYGIEEKSEKHSCIGVNMRDRAIWGLIALYVIFLGVQPLAAQNPIHTPPYQTKSQNRSVQKRPSHEEIPSTIRDIWAWIQSRVNDPALASHTAEFHDDHVKWQGRETYTVSGLEGCSFTLSRQFDFQSGPYSQNGKTSGSRSRVLETIGNIDLRDLDPTAIQTEMQSDSMKGETAALILRTTARKQTLRVHKKEDIHFFDKVSKDASTFSDDSSSEVVVHIRDIEAADRIAEAFQRVISRCGGIGIPKDID